MNHSSKACERALDSLQECFPSLALPSYTHGQSLEFLLNVPSHSLRTLPNPCPSPTTSPFPSHASKPSVMPKSTASSAVNSPWISSPASPSSRTSAKKSTPPTWAASPSSAVNNTWTVTSSTRSGGPWKRRTKASISSTDSCDIYGSLLHHTTTINRLRQIHSRRIDRKSCLGLTPTSGRSLGQPPLYFRRKILLLVTGDLPPGNLLEAFSLVGKIGFSVDCLVRTTDDLTELMP